MELAVKNLVVGVLAVTFIRIGISKAKMYEPCELAQEMITKYRFPKADIADWICLIRHESNFDTSVIGRLNADGSLDHGLFQISDLFWCTHGDFDGACGVSCDALRDDDIQDDSKCARRIFRVTSYRTGNGFDAWVGWTQHCRGANVQQYISNCTLN